MKLYWLTAWSWKHHCRVNGYNIERQTEGALIHVRLMRAINIARLMHQPCPKGLFSYEISHLILISFESSDQSCGVLNCCSSQLSVWFDPPIQRMVQIRSIHEMDKLLIVGENCVLPTLFSGALSYALTPLLQICWGFRNKKKGTFYNLPRPASLLHHFPSNHMQHMGGGSYNRS
jgi:hypothetical protein